MNEKIKKIIQNPKFLVILGVCGILLIFLSSIFSTNDKNKKDIDISNTDTYTTEQYCSLIEDDVKNIVTGITGDKNPTVVVTLESGIRYSYASADETDISSSSGNTTDESSILTNCMEKISKNVLETVSRLSLTFAISLFP